MKRKRKRTSDPGWWEEHREQFERTDRLLKERMAYHRAKLIEGRPGWTPPASDEEWAAYNEARIRSQIVEREKGAPSD